jgi:hypothetical protein
MGLLISGQRTWQQYAVCSAAVAIAVTPGDRSDEAVVLFFCAVLKQLVKTFGFFYVTCCVDFPRSCTEVPRSKIHII